MAHKYHRYTDSAEMQEAGRKLPNAIRYIAMAFRPAGVLLFCVALTAVVSIPCVAAILNSSYGSTAYNIAMAILTGVIASGLVSVSIELANNYRHNRQRFVVLNEYLYMASMYEQFIIWASHGEYEEYKEDTGIDWGSSPLHLTARLWAVAAVILEFGSVVENAVSTGREYFSLKELQWATKAVDAADRLGEIAGDIAYDHLKGGYNPAYDMFEDDFGNKIKAFSESAGIYFSDEKLESVVCDYVLSNLDVFGLDGNGEGNGYNPDQANRDLIIHCLRNFDEAMHMLQKFVVFEPVVYDNLIPMEEKIKQWEKKIGIDDRI